MRYEKEDFELAKRFCKVAIGTDSFYRKEQKANCGEASFAAEGLIPVDFTGESPAAIRSWEQAVGELSEIYHAYERIKDPIRRNYMLQQVSSFRKVCLWLSGFPVSFREIAAETMFIDENPVGAAVLEKRMKHLEELLREAGYQGTLKEQVRSWREKRKISKPEDVKTVLEQLLCEAKERTTALGFEAVRDFDVHAELVYHVPYNAYCDYKSRMIYINGEVTYTYDELKHLVCHEAYPGHMTHMAVRQSLLEQGKIPADAGLVLTNTASSPVFEGLADQGVDILDWNLEIHDKICRQLNQIQSICNQNASDIYYREEDGPLKAEAYMKEYSFADDDKIKARLRYMGYPFRKAYMYAYWRGWEAVEQTWNLLKKTERPEFLKYLYENMHSIDTVLQFKEQ